jgi:hypothetical protein
VTIDLGRLNTNAQGNLDPELPAYWVFGTEQPHVVINEVLAEHPDVTVYPAAGDPDPNLDNLKIWVELLNTMQGPNPAPLQQFDASSIPLLMPKQTSGSANPNATGAAYGVYQLVISNGLEPRPFNDNVLGKPAAYPITQRPMSGAPLPLIEDFYNPRAPGIILWNTFPNPPKAQPAPTLAPGQFLLIGPSTAGDATKYQDPWKPGATTVPNGTPVIASTMLDYVPMFPHQASPVPDERQTGVTVLLRRLANPHIPWDPYPNVVTVNSVVQPNPWYNPYVTVDYITQVAVVDGKAGRSYQSRGKRQPYAARMQLNGGSVYTVNPDSPVVPQGTAAVNGVRHTFGQQNNPVPQSGHYDWMVHLDRQPISPPELLHVSGYQPHQLTQQFVTGSNADPTKTFQHYVPWFDQRTRLYRLFEFFDCTEWNATFSPLDFIPLITGRVPGKVNINTIWDPEILQALCDANASNWISDPAVIQTIFQNMMNSRTPQWAANQLTSNDQPFLGQGVGFTAAGDKQWPNGLGIQNTLFRSVGGKLLLQNPADAANVHPYLQYEMLTKIYNNLTPRSNVFAVWVTVGFFQVMTDANGSIITVDGKPNSPPQLGAEIGRSEGRHVRHRMFAIVNRTYITGYSGPKTTRYEPRQDSSVVPYYSIIN